MGTLPHTNPENGYALRIGKHLPQEAANLVYVHMDSPTPEKNIIVEDYSHAEMMFWAIWVCGPAAAPRGVSSSIP